MRLFVVTIVFKVLRAGERKHLRSRKVVLAPHGTEALRRALLDEEASLIEACHVEDQGDECVVGFGAAMVSTSEIKAAQRANSAGWVFDLAPGIPNERFVRVAAD
jgi:hypothetical protein